MTYNSQKKSSIKARAKTLQDADQFAKITFIQLRKDDTCWKRFLRFFRFIPPQKVEINEIAE
jgi:hypothetical protein